MPRVTDWACITRTPTGYFVKVQVRPYPPKAQRFKAGTPLSTMQKWRDDVRATLETKRKAARDRDEAPTTLAEDVARYLTLWGKGIHPVTVAERTRFLRWWGEHFEGRERHTLTTAEIEAALTGWQASDGFGAASWNKRRIALRMVFAVLDRGAGRVNPVTLVPAAKEPPPKARGLPMPLVRQLLEAVAQPEHQARLGMMAFIGLRPEEVMRILPTDVDWKGATLYVRSAKNSQTATVPLLPEALSWLKRFHALNAYGRYSLNRQGDAFAQAVAHVNGARAVAGLPALQGLRPYDLRHSFGTEFYRVTKDLKATKEAMRHKVLTTTERYVEGSVSAVLLDGVRAVAAAHADTQRRPADTQSDTHRRARRGQRGPDGVRTGKVVGVPKMPFSSRPTRNTRGQR